MVKPTTTIAKAVNAGCKTVADYVKFMKGGN